MWSWYGIVEVMLLLGEAGKAEVEAANEKRPELFRVIRDLDLAEEGWAAEESCR